MAEAALTPAPTVTSTAAPASPAATPVESKAPPVKPSAHPAGTEQRQESEPTDEYEIDGRTVTLTRTQARTMLQKAGAADKRLREAAEERKKLEEDKKKIAEILSLLETDPEAAYAKTGKDPSPIIEKLLAQRAKAEMMTPEQRELAKKDAELATLRAEKEKLDANRKAERQAEIDRHNEDAICEALASAADAHNLDKTPEAMELMLEIALEAAQLGLPLTPAQVAQEVILKQAEHIEARDKKLMPRLKGERLLTFLGDEVLREIEAAKEARRQASLKAIPVPTLKPKPRAPPPAVARAENGRFISETEFEKKLGLRR